MSSNIKFFLVFLLVLLALSLTTLFGIFNLALFGDDWLVFWRYLKILGPYSSGEYSHLSYLFTLYGPMDILFGIMEKIFGYNAIYYHLTAYIFRIIAALSVYLLSNYLLQNKTASIFAAIFFSITSIGFDTTNWVFNMTAYLSIASLNVFLYLFLKSQSQKKLLLYSGIFYFLANILAPIRMTSTLPIVILIEIYLLFKDFNTKRLKYSLLRIAFICLISFIVVKLGSFGASSGWMFNIVSGFDIFKEEITKGRTDLIFYLLVSVGGMILPEQLLANFQISRKFQLITDIILPSLVIFTSLVVVLEFYVYKTKKIISLLFAGILSSLIVVLIYTQNNITFSGSEYIVLLLVAFYTLIISILLYLRNIKNDISLAIFIALNLIIFSFFIAWWRSPTTIFETTHRYLIVAATGVSILFGVISAILLHHHKKILSVIFMIVILAMHISATKIYINSLNNLHNQRITDQIWNSFPYIPDIINNPGPIIFFFSSDSVSPSISHNVITFGFPPHIALLYHTSEMTTISMDDWEELVSSIHDGQSLKKYGFIQNPVPIENIYAFHLKEKSILENKTDEVREKLKKTIIK